MDAMIVGNVLFIDISDDSDVLTWLKLTSLLTSYDVRTFNIVKCGLVTVHGKGEVLREIAQKINP